MNKQTKNARPVIILGSTGSIGLQALDVAERHGYEVRALAARSNANVLSGQIRSYRVRYAAMTDPEAANELRTLVRDLDVRIYSGTEGMLDMIRDASVSGPVPTVLNAVSGAAGLRPSLCALDSGCPLALANKESLVLAGEIVMAKAKEKNLPVLPVDSEHCALWQCLKAGRRSEVDALILTASGGPFFGLDRDELKNKAARDALAHPTWHMGAQITIDSATLMNKGFEIMEAVWLFGIPEDRIEVLVHRQSIVHSMVRFCDRSVIAQMSVPDMRFCIAHAIEYPKRLDAVIDELDLASVGSLDFAKPDTDSFPALGLARFAYRQGGAMPAVLNAANEIAVDAYLEGRTGFYGITDIVLRTMTRLQKAKDEHSLDGILYYDAEARKAAASYLLR